MKCEKYLDLIDDLVEGELDAQTAEQVNLHVFACNECALQYETLKQEKEIYAHYLFDVEPSADLSAKFQAKLRAETNQTSETVEKSLSVSNWKSSLNGFWRLSPILAGAILILIIGIGFGSLKFAPVETVVNEEFTTKKNSANKETTAPISEIVEDKTPDLTTKNADDKIDYSLRRVKNNEANKSSYKQKNVAVKNNKFVVAEIKTKKKPNTGDAKEDSAIKIRLTEQQRQFLLASDLEKETFKQIEKIELLLRSFRNARSIENTETFDVAYEKEQARKLLGKNVRLRQNAGNYAAFYAEELLDRAEPLLLEIANLGSDSSAEKVLEIKERVRNQNIIASLQIYK